MLSERTQGSQTRMRGRPGIAKEGTRKREIKLLESFVICHGKKQASVSCPLLVFKLLASRVFCFISFQLGLVFLFP